MLRLSCVVYLCTHARVCACACFIQFWLKFSLDLSLFFLCSLCVIQTCQALSLAYQSTFVSWKHNLRRPPRLQRDQNWGKWENEKTSEREIMEQRISEFQWCWRFLVLSLCLSPSLCVFRSLILSCSMAVTLFLWGVNMIWIRRHTNGVQ